MFIIHNYVNYNTNNASVCNEEWWNHIIYKYNKGCCGAVDDLIMEMHEEKNVHTYCYKFFLFHFDFSLSLYISLLFLIFYHTITPLKPNLLIGFRFVYNLKNKNINYKFEFLTMHCICGNLSRLSRIEWYAS